MQIPLMTRITSVQVCHGELSQTGALGMPQSLLLQVTPGSSGGKFSSSTSNPQACGTKVAGDGGWACGFEIPEGMT